MPFDQTRAADVETLVGMMKTLTGRDVDPQTMHDAWQARSDGVCASWLVFDENDEDDRQEVRRAFDSFIEQRFRETIAAVVPEHDHELVVDFVRTRGSDSFDETDDLVAVTDAEGGDAILAQYRRWSSLHVRLAVDLLEHFGIELPEGHDLDDAQVLAAFRLGIDD